MSEPAPISADARVDRVVRRGTMLAVWLSLLLVTYWWDAGGGITDLSEWASGLTSVGRLTGLWAANLLLFQVLMMSRRLRWNLPSAGTGWPAATD